MEERTYWLAWSKVAGVGPVLLRRLQQHFGTLATAWNATPAALEQVDGFGRSTVERIVQSRSQIQPEKFLQQHQQQNPCFWTPADPDYPRLLLETPNPPPVLYCRGQFDAAENLGQTPMVGIVGTREPSEYGKRWTRKISTALAKSGFTIVSGLAAGIDTEAHQGCLDAGGRTLAILGTGVDIVYPPRNRLLYEAILKQGGVLSEYPAGTGPDRAHFPQRNRIIAGLSRAVLVMEAPTKSGALITAHLANDFCRDVYALPGRLDDHLSQGCLDLIKNGAEIIPKEIEELLKMLGAIPAIDAPTEAVHPVSTQLSLFEQVPVPKLEPELAKVLQVVPVEPTSLDSIVQEAGLAAGSVSSALLQLELLGLVTQLPGMRYQRS